MHVFFFQAEDGIRDGHVTGVQTCALPISPLAAAPQAQADFGDLFDFSWLADIANSADADGDLGLAAAGGFDMTTFIDQRSEERRVGKECSCSWSPDDENNRGRGDRCEASK